MTKKHHEDNTGEGGRLYELELLVLFLQKANHRKMNYHLGREVQDAGKFDDLVFRYKKGEKSYSRYLQAKHCLHEDAMITSKVLFPSQHDRRNNLAGKFHLDKYLRSFISICHQHKTNSAKMGNLEDLIIFTNVDFDYEELQSKGIETQRLNDDFLDFSTPNRQAKLFHLKTDSNSELCSKLKDCSDCFVLANEIILQVEQSRNSPANRKQPLLGASDSASKEYARALLSEVIQRRNDHFVFQERFLQGSNHLTEKAVIFRTKLLNIAMERYGYTEEDFLKKATDAVLVGTKVWGRKTETEFQDLPIYEITNQDMEEFFSYLVFAVNQPNATQLKSFIADKQLKESFGCIDTEFIAESLENKILNWIKERKSEGWIDTTDGEVFFEKVNKMIASVILVGICLPYVNSFLEVANIRDLDPVREIRKREDRKCLVIKSKETFLTCCKLYNLLKEESKDSIFVNSSMLGKTETLEKIIEGFKNTANSMLVIECKERFSNEIVTELTEAAHRAKKILIFVSPHGFVFDSEFAIEQMEDGEFYFGDLSIESQNYILNKEIMFQGSLVKLSDIIDEEAAERILKGRMIAILARGQERAKFGEPIQKQKGFDEEYYINRCFLQRRKIRRKTRKDLDFEAEETKRHFGPDHHQNVHFDNSSLETIGEFVEKFREFVEVVGVMEKTPEEELSLSTERLIVISDSAGMGKSTVLTSLCDRIKRQCPAKWAKRINLNDHTAALAKHKKERIDSRDDAIRFFRKVILEPREHSKETNEDLLELELYDYYLEKKEKETAIFLDGLDEICPDYKQVILNLIKVLFEQTEIGTLVLTTRPHMKTDLECSLNVSAYSMEPFSVEEQIDFLAEFWRRRNPKLTDTIRVRKYAESLIDALSLSIRDEERELTGIPLQSMMVAEIFERRKVQDSGYDDDSEDGDEISCSLEEYYFSDNEEPSIPDITDLSTLYKQFVRIKYWDILESRKRQIDISKPDMRERVQGSYVEFLNDYKLLALFTLLPENYMDVLGPTQKDRTENLVKDIRAGKDKNGLVNEIVDGKPQFLHRTFTEYFFVELLIDYFLSRNREKKYRFLQRVLQKFRWDAVAVKKSGYNERKFDAFIFEEVLIKEDYQTVRQFLETKLGPITAKIQMRLDTELLLNPRKKSKNTAVHVAMAADYSNIVRFLERCFGDRIKHVIEYQNADGKEVIEYAACKGNLEMVKWIVDKGVTVRDKSDLLHASAESGSSELVKYLVRRYLEEDSALFKDSIINRKNASGKTPLHLAATYGDVNTLDSLLQEGAAIDSEDDQSDTPLILVAKEGKTDIVKFLFDNGANIYHKNNYHQTAFQEALRYGNLQTVKFFITKGSSIHEESEAGWQALHFASAGGKVETVQFLLESDADISKKDVNGCTPLHLASGSKSVKTVEVLLQHGADLNARDLFNNTPILHAANAGRHDTILYLKENGADVQARNRYGATAFGLALRFGNLETVKFLLSIGFDINVETEYESTALHIAAEGTRDDTLQFLLDMNANVHKKDVSGLTPLHYAAEYGNIKTVELLLRYGANLHARDNDGNTPFLRAASTARHDILVHLAEHGADLRDKNNYKSTAMHLSLLYGSLESVKYLISKAMDLNEPHEYGRRALHIACQGGKDETISFLLDNNADVHRIDQNGQTPLHVASQHGYVTTVEILLKHGANIHAQDNHGNTPLILALAKEKHDNFVYLLTKGANLEDKSNNRTAFEWALRFGPVETLQYLASRGLNIHQEDEEGWDALLYASAAGRDEAVKFLLQNNANVHKEDGKGQTPLHVASRYGNVKTVEILLRHGANVQSKDKYSNTPLLQAARGGNHDIMVYLVENGADLRHAVMIEGRTWTVFHFALRYSSLESVKFLLSNGFSIHDEDKDARQALHSAVLGKNEEIIQYLLENKADVNKKDAHCTTPLLLASERGNLKAVERLLRCGAEINAKDGDGDTPLLVAAYAGNEDILAHLVENGADLQVKNKDGENALKLALKNEHIEIVNYLISKGLDTYT